MNEPPGMGWDGTASLHTYIRSGSIVQVESCADPIGGFKINSYSDLDFDLDGRTGLGWYVELVSFGRKKL